MSTWLIAAMGVVYFYVACEQFWKGSAGTGIMFLGYAMGNIGLVMVAKQGTRCGQNATVQSLTYQNF